MLIYCVILKKLLKMLIGVIKKNTTSVENVMLFRDTNIFDNFLKETPDGLMLKVGL